MSRPGVYVNLLSHSPINTPCPDHRSADYDFIDDTIVTDHPCRTQNPKTGNLTFEVEIHDNTESSRDQEIKNLLDFDTDDENILNSLNVLISDPSSLDETPRRFAYPDANSHSNYNLLNDEDTPSSEVSRSRNNDLTIVKRNSLTTKKLGDIDKILLSDNSETNASFDACSSYSIANSHGVYGLMSDQESEKTWDNMSRESLIKFETSENYEIANSHSNYQVYYNRVDNADWNVTDDDWTRFATGNITDQVKSCGQFPHDSPTCNGNPDGTSCSSSEKNTEETSDTCDIEDCLIQIEESLINIEQNLLHVQELDISELKTLLYENSGSERSAKDAKDNLPMDNHGTTKRSNLIVNEADDRRRSNDENCLQFQDKREILERAELSCSLPCDNVWPSIVDSCNKNTNFIPNSLGKVPMRTRRRELSENITENEKNPRRRSLDDDIVDLINYNLNNFTNTKKSFNRQKCQIRTSSLDENSIFGLIDNDDCRMIIENDFSSGSRINAVVGGKARSENAIGLTNNDLDYGDEKMGDFSSRRDCEKSRETRIAEVEAKAEEFRRMIENIVTNRRRAIGKSETDFSSKKTWKNCNRSGETGGDCGRDKSSPKITLVGDSASDKNQENFRENGDSPVTNKPHVYEKKKRKKLTNRGQTSENALVPSKIISLSLSLLLAALLQAVRCLADLVEDAFRSVSFERNGLLE